MNLVYTKLERTKPLVKKRTCFMVKSVIYILLIIFLVVLYKLVIGQPILPNGTWSFYV